MIKGSIKGMTDKLWEAHYDGQFYSLFKDYRMLTDAAKRRDLSSSEEAQKRVIEKLIDTKLH